MDSSYSNRIISHGIIDTVTFMSNYYKTHTHEDMEASHPVFRLGGVPFSIYLYNEGGYTDFLNKDMYINCKLSGDDKIAKMPFSVGEWSPAMIDSLDIVDLIAAVGTESNFIILYGAGEKIPQEYLDNMYLH